MLYYESAAGRCNEALLLSGSSRASPRSGWVRTSFEVLRSRRHRSCLPCRLSPQPIHSGHTRLLRRALFTRIGSESARNPFPPTRATHPSKS